MYSKLKFPITKCMYSLLLFCNRILACHVLLTQESMLEVLKTELLFTVAALTHLVRNFSILNNHSIDND